MSLLGKTCLITGANSGLGLATAKRFAALEANVVMLCRDPKKGEAAVNEVLRETPGASLELVICNLASLRSLHDFIKSFKETHSKIDVLVNNAAVMKNSLTMTEDGLEMDFQTNYLAPVLLTLSFIDLLESSSGRIINIAVPTNDIRLNFEDLQSVKRYGGYSAFFRTKLCLLLFSLELSRKLSGTGITVNVTDPGPGPFKSNLTREGPWIFGVIRDLLFGTAENAAETIVFLATSEELRSKTGGLFLGKQEKPIQPYWADQEIRKKLWDLTVSLIQTCANSIEWEEIVENNKYVSV